MSYLGSKYAYMLKAGLPKETVIQSICTDFQCNRDHPSFTNIISWVDRISLGGDKEPVPTEFVDLSNTKYQRMTEKGTGKGQVEFIKKFDDYDKNKRMGIEADIPVDTTETASVGEVLNDRVVNDSDLSSEKSLSEQRAKDLKKEAYAIIRGFRKVDVEKVTDEQDSAPLTTESKVGQPLENDQQQFHTYIEQGYPEPEILRQEEMQIIGISDNNHPCIFREHLPERMFSYLNVLTSEECSDLIKRLNFDEQEELIQQQKIKTAVNSNQFLVRTNIRRNFIDDDIARAIWRTVKSSVPNTLQDGRKLSGIRSKMNYYRYGEGQFFF